MDAIAIELTVTPTLDQLESWSKELSDISGIGEVDFARSRDLTEVIRFTLEIVGSGFLVSGSVIELAKKLRQQAKELYKLREGEKEKTAVDKLVLMEVEKPDGTKFKIYGNMPEEQIVSLLSDSNQPKQG